MDYTYNAMIDLHSSMLNLGLLLKDYIILIKGGKQGGVQRGQEGGVLVAMKPFHEKHYK